MAAVGDPSVEKPIVNMETEDFLCESLDRLKLDVTSKQGKQTQVSALHIGFMEPKQFVLFKPFPLFNIDDEAIDKMTSADEEEWLERMMYIEGDLHWLLKLPHHRFWSQVVYDEDLQKCLESYLSYAPRDYDLNSSITEGMLSLLKSVHKLVFLVFLRMSTYKESKLHHITPAVFGDIIYDNFLFDIPKLMDLCVLYAHGNQVLLCKMIQNIFTTQPKYMADLIEIVPAIMQVFQTIEQQLGLNKLTYEDEKKPLKLEETVTSNLSSKSLTSLQDIICYITDTIATLHAFLDTYLPACSPFYKSGVATKLASFYDLVLICVENELKIRKETEQPKIVEQMRKRIALSKSFLIKIFRNLIVSCCIQPILEANIGDNEECNSESRLSNSLCMPYLEDFLQILTEVVAEKSFIRDYNQFCPLEIDLDMFAQADLNIDPTRLNYIFDGICNSSEPLAYLHSSMAAASLPDSKPSELPIINADSRKNSAKDLHSIAAQLTDGSLQAKNGDMDYSTLENPSATPAVNGIELESLIQSILDILPGFGTGFIEACLEYYNYNAEQVIDALLQYTLPESLDKLDRNLQRKMKIQSNLDDFEKIPYSALSERKNIYDNDEFDIFNRQDVDLKKIHIGKKDKTPQTYQAIENEEDIKFLKEICQNYSIVENYAEEDTGLYEDEYDDTYDSAMLGLEEPQLENEITIRPFTTPRILQSSRRVEEDVYEEDKMDEETPLEQAKNRDEFIPNPAVLRERAEQRRQTKLRNKQSQHQPPRSSVEGQDHNQKTEQNQRQKERHKGQVANHNRRKQADWKRSRGMFSHPS